MNQREVWSSIAEKWKEYRQNTISEVIKFLKNKKGKILDLGCGSGRNLIANPNIIYYGVDFSEKMLKFAEQKAKKEKRKAVFFKADAGKGKLPFENEFFDSALFISTLHCIEGEKNRKNALKEIYRVLKKEAEAVITVWDKEANKNFKNLKAREGFANWKKEGVNYQRYYYFYNREELTQLLKEVGFEIIKISSQEEKESTHSKKNFIFYVKK